MTPTQFVAIAKLIRSAEGPAQAAARLVLVEGVAPSLAATQSGCSPQSCSQAVRRFRDANDLIEEAFLHQN